MAPRPIYLLSPTPREGTLTLPMIRFSVVADTIVFDHCDTLIFTSKQAVKVADSIDKRWKNYPCIAIGGATKRQIEDLGGEVIYYPRHFYGETLAQDITDFFSDRKLLYLRPETVSFDAKAFLAKKGIDLQEQVIYRTSCLHYSQNEAPPEESIIIFTSPSTIHCFLENFSWDSSYTAVVIGEATKVHLPPDAHCKVADTPLISACIAKAEEILLSSNSK